MPPNIKRGTAPRPDPESGPLHTGEAPDSLVFSLGTGTHIGMTPTTVFCKKMVYLRSQAGPGRCVYDEKLFRFHLLTVWYIRRLQWNYFTAMVSVSLSLTALSDLHPVPPVVNAVIR